jgi:hypothetical protein
MEESSNKPNFSVLKYFATIIKEVGIVGFIIAFLASIFLIYSSDEQKTEFINKFILLKNTDENLGPCVFVVLFLILIIIMGSIYFSKMLKLRKAENRRIGEEKTRLQEALIGKKLQSSNNKK